MALFSRRPKIGGGVSIVGRMLQRLDEKYPWLVKVYTGLVKGFEEALAIIYVARVTLFAALFTFCVLLLPDQSRDCFRVLVEDLAGADSLQAFARGPLFYLFIQVFLAFTLWYWGRVTLEFTVGGYLNPDSGQSRLRVLAVKWLPRLSGCAPMMASAWGFWSVCSGEGHRASGLWLTFLSLLLGSLFLFLVIARQGFSPGWARLFLSEVHASHLGWGVLRFTLLFLLLGVGIGIIVTMRPYAPIRPNSLSMLLLGIAVWSVLANALVWLGRGLRLPLLSGGLVFSLVWSALDLNDNHRLRVVPEHMAREVPAPFDVGAWQADRLRRAPHGAEKKPLPMIIVAAEGGGIYAAYHTAYVLAKLQDREPAFGRHVIAISGVSGGAIGATVYASLRAAEDDGWKFRPERNIGDDGTRNREASKYVLSADYLAPVVAMGAFPDLFQTLLPYPFDLFDRARGLESTLDSRLDQLFVDVAGPRAFSGVSKTFLGGTTPALFINTTRVDTGSRLVLGSVALGREVENGGAWESPERRFGFNTLETLNPGMRPLVSSAAFASARFPYITPVAYVHSTLEGDPSKVRLADGGYFENSGLATVLDILHVIRKETNKDTHTPKPHLIVLHIGAREERGASRSLREPGLAFGEALSPIRTLLSTRRARGETAAQQVNRALTEFADDGYKTSYFEAFLDVEKHDIPLGWQLSRLSRDKIESVVNDSEVIEKLVSLLGPGVPASSTNEPMLNKSTL